jgi:NNP family nitrate/nitrite transporter-like MFS transporter
MRLRELRAAGHWPTLFAAFLHFDVSFAVWYVLGPLANFIAEDLGLVTGLVGAAGGLGGFFLPSLLGLLRDATGGWSTGFLVSRP